MRYILLYVFRVSQRVPSEMLLLGQRYPDKKERNSEIYFIIFLSGNEIMDSSKMPIALYVFLIF